MFEKQSESILNNIPGGSAVFSERGGRIRLDYANDRFYELHHGTREFWTNRGDDPSDWLVPADRHIFEDEFLLVSTGKKKEGNVSYCVTGQDGRRHWINNLFRRAYEDDGVQYYYAFFTGLDKLKEAEEERSNLYLMYEAAVEDAKLTVWEYDISAHRVVMAENEFTKYDYRKFGLPKIIDDVPRSLVPYIDEKDVPVFLAMYRAVDEGEPGASCDVWYKTVKGQEPRCEHIRYVTVYDESGKAVKAYGMGRNITAQKLEHEKYDMLYKQINATLSEAVSSTQLNLSKNKYISGYSINPAVSQMLARSSADGHFAAAAQAVTDDTIRAELLSVFNSKNLIRMFKNGQSQVSRKYPVRSSSGELLWIDTTVYLLQNPTTGDIEALTYAKDITKLTKDEEIIRYLAKDGCDFIGVISMPSRTFSLHDGLWDCGAACGGKALSYDEAREKLADEQIAPEERAGFLQMTELGSLMKDMSSERQKTIVYSSAGTSGTVLRKQLRFCMLGKDGQDVLVVQNDITEASEKEQQQIRQLQDALVEAERANTAKTEFISRISHDIRTPISIISSMIRFAHEDMDDRRKLGDDLAKIESSNIFLLSLINDVLDISKIDSGKIELHPEPFTYDDYISDIRNMFEPLCRQKNISFKVTEKTPATVISVDKARLNQITLNLLSNAVKYTQEGGAVSFSSYAEKLPDKKVLCTISITDSGIGMSEAFQKTMFEPFTQEYDNPGRDKTTVGTGLGLSIVKKLVDLMKGTITVRSELGKRTEVSVSFMADDAMQADNGLHAAEQASAHDNRTMTGTLLLAEDNIINTEIAVRILSSFGFTVKHAENGKEAVELFASSEPGTYAGILMDIQMPVMNGYDAAAGIRALVRPDAATVPIIAMTADAFAAAVEHSKAVGMNDYITKPIDPDALRAVLEKYCI